MEALSLFVLMIATFSQVASCEKLSTESKAIIAILKEFYSIESPKVDFIYYGLEGGKSEKLANEVLRHKPESISVSVSKGDVKNSWKNKLNSSSILLFDSAQNFRDHNISWLSDQHVRHKHLVYFPNTTANDVKHIQDGFSIDNVNFLVNESESSIDLATSFMFYKSCRSLSVHIINSFKVCDMKWNSSIFFPNKYSNFRGCSLLTFSSRSTVTLAQMNIIKSFAKSTNATLFYIVARYIKGKVNMSNVDLMLDTATWSIAYNSTNTLTYPYYIDHWVFLIPPGELYTQFEKVFLPFQPEVWISIVVFLLFSVVVIQLIKLTSENFQSLVFGRNVQTPTINITSTFLTGVQLKVPEKTFARFLFINFVVWSLIFRTCYQSELFKYLQNDMRKPEPRTIVELIKNNFTFIGNGFLDKEISAIAESNALPR